MLLERIQLQNLLSFGPETEELDLQPLNVLIGTNGSGKTNFVEAIGLLRAVPGDIAGPMCSGRGATDWIWQGHPRADSAHIQAVVHPADRRPLRYSLRFAAPDRRLTVINERLMPADGDPRPFFEVSDGSRAASLRIDVP